MAMKMETISKPRRPLKPKTIKTVVGLVKRIVASAVDAEGKQLHRPEWNNEFMEVPIVEKRKQKRPSITSEFVSGLGRYAVLKMRVLFILLGATGARIGEMLGIEINKHISEDFRTLYIRQKVHNGKIEHYLKTASSYRDIDLHPAIAEILRSYVGARKSGLVFCTSTGKPLSPRYVYGHLYRALNALGYKNNFDGDSKAGFHMLRRFRDTFLRNHTNCRPGLITYWMGWGDDDGEDYPSGPAKSDRNRGSAMPNLYDTIADNRPFRLSMAQECGFGFDLPSFAPNVPNNGTVAETDTGAQLTDDEGVDFWI